MAMTSVSPAPRPRLNPTVVAPGGDASVAVQGEAVVGARGDGDDVGEPVRHLRLAEAVVAPGDDASGPDRRRWGGRTGEFLQSGDVGGAGQAAPGDVLVLDVEELDESIAVEQQGQRGLLEIEGEQDLLGDPLGGSGVAGHHGYEGGALAQLLVDDPSPLGPVVDALVRPHLDAGGGEVDGEPVDVRLVLVAVRDEDVPHASIVEPARSRSLDSDCLLWILV